MMATNTASSSTYTLLPNDTNTNTNPNPNDNGNDNDNDNGNTNTNTDDDDDDEAVPRIGRQQRRDDDDNDDDDDDDDENVTTTNTNDINTEDDEEEEEEEEEERGEGEEYTVYTIRFVILFLFAVNNLLGSAVWITFAPITEAVQRTYHVSAPAVNWLAMISMVVYGPGTFLVMVSTRPSGWGFATTIVLSSSLMSLGCGFRWWSSTMIHDHDDNNNNNNTDNDTDTSSWYNGAYSVLLLGQGLVALGQTIFLNAPARIAASWFQQTTKAIGMIQFLNSVGMVLGQLLPPMMVEETTGRYLDTVLWGQLLAMVVTTTATALVFLQPQYHAPETPPTCAEAVRRHHRHEEERHRRHAQITAGFQDEIMVGGTIITFPPPATATTTIATYGATHTTNTKTMLHEVWNDVRTLLTDRHYMVLLMAFGFQYSITGATLTVLQPWLASVGFQGGDTVAGLCGSVMVFTGVLGTGIASSVLDYTKDYTTAIRSTFVLGFIAALELVVVALHPSTPIWLVLVSFGVSGVTQGPILTICLDTAAAHTYPISEEISSAGLQLFGQYLGIVLVIWMEQVITVDTKEQNIGGFNSKTNILYVSLLGLSSIFACYYKNNDRRTDINNTEHQQHGNNSGTTTSSIHRPLLSQ